MLVWYARDRSTAELDNLEEEKIYLKVGVDGNMDNDWLSRDKQTLQVTSLFRRETLVAQALLFSSNIEGLMPQFDHNVTQLDMY